MAKEKKEEKKEATTKVSILGADAETVEQHLNELTTATDEITEKALAEMQEEKNNDIKNETKQRIGQAQFEHLRSVLTLKRSRKMEELAKERMHRSEGLLCALTGIPVEHKDTIIDGKPVDVGFVVPKDKRLSYVDYDAKRREMSNDMDKKEREIAAWYDGEEKKLRSSFVARYRNVWGW